MMIFRTLLGLLLLLIAALPAAAAPRVVNVTLLVFSDIYEIAEKNGRGGFARVAGALAAERARAKNVIVAHAGDTLSPSLMSSLDKGAHIVDLLNRMKLDVFTPGNHEFDFGEAVFRTRMAEATFPIVASNLRDGFGKQLLGFADNRIFDMGGVKIGVFGLTDEESAKRSNTGALRFAPIIDTARIEAERLRDAGADIIVAVTHSDWKDDLRLAKLGVIDVVLSGHDHNLLVAYDGRSAIAETQADGVNIVAVDLAIRVDDGDKRKVAWTPKFRIIDTADVKPDAAVAARVAQYQAKISKELDAVIGETRTPLDSRKASVRGHETAIGNLITDAMRAATGADVALLNGGAIRGNRTYDAGEKLTCKDVMTELPFDDTLVTLELSGADLRAALENAVWMLGRDDGRFGQISGARIVARSGPVSGSRLVSVEIGGKPLDDARVYKVAVTNFLAHGKDGYDMLTRGKPLVNDLEGPQLATVVIDAIRKAGAVAPAIDGRITLQ
ncbi:bifunctional metallophosphatase/5'-nucleotidase [Methylocystis sp. WRRC1]|uniref:bifunctional metallophosphatase/5'-nucleotidase n=1 Tax=Methylocystis sp. WRRC1 TaxID=1732014 RepID=UPI001D13955B|nr:bifunctional UDP-sugar hydrolase/5'-nucleotidase [Methylocystis sp. WRRC1]MCC3244302.1 bifunctional metallophosphatase/5'-nucleotidase [Methylocystis sp. WRRC1]